MIRLYVDEDAMRISFTNILREIGFDVLTADEANQIGKDDSNQLTFATENSRVLFSHNIKDFMQLHETYLRTGKDHGGILLSPQRKYKPKVQANLIRAISREYSAETIQNELLFLSNWEEVQ